METTTISGSYLCTLAAQVEAPITVARFGEMQRKVIPIIGGTVTGRIEGKILPGGADWQFAYDSGATDLEAHYCLELDGGDVVEVKSAGVRSGDPEVIAKVMAGEDVSPDAYYFRTSIKFRTSSERYAWLNRILTVGICGRDQNGVLIRLFEID